MRTMKRFLLSEILVFLLGCLSIDQGIAQAPATVAIKTFTNPLGKGADPWVITAGNKFWYCGSQNGGIFVSSSDSLHSILKKKKNSIFTPPAKCEYSHEIWAPELHFLQGRWYVYFAADSSDNQYHRMYVLEGGSDAVNPLNGNYIFKGKLAAVTDYWAIDGSAFEYKNQLYFVWSGWPGKTNVTQCLYMAKMKNPYTLDGERVEISCPTESWETIGNPTINEGPEVLIRNNTVHIIYSASGSWTDDYCLGRLTCKNGDIMNKNSWVKAGPVFSKTEDVFGPGHASFVNIPDKNSWWIVYHAARGKGSGWDRDVRIQSFTWEGDDPIFGKPVSTQVKITIP